MKSVLAIVTVAAACCHAATVDIGFLSIERGSPFEGVASFLVANLTGPEGCTPDFPVCTPLSIWRPELTVRYLDKGVPVTVTRVLNEGFPPGLQTRPEFIFSEDFEFEFARLKATHGDIIATLYDGTSGYAPQGTFETELDLSSREFAPIKLDLGPVPVPEPCTSTLAGFALLLGVSFSWYRRRWRRSRNAVLLVGLLTLGSLSAQVHLSSVTPPNALIGSTTITVVGSGFPSGIIGPSNVSVLLDRAFRFTTDPPTAITPASVIRIAGGTYRIRFVVPAGFDLGGNAADQYTVGISGRTDSGQDFMSGNQALVVLWSHMGALGTTPASARAGMSALVTLNSVPSGLPFIPGVTRFTVPPELILRRLPGPTSPNTLDLVIPETARLGTYFITATIGVHQLRFPFEVLRADAWLNTLTPRESEMGQSLDVLLRGVGTHWKAGLTQIDFGPDITVQRVVVHDETSATATIAIAPAIESGARTVSVTTGTDRVYAPDLFTVSPSHPTLISVIPSAFRPGQTVSIEVRGNKTHFQEGVTFATMGPGIRVQSMQVISTTLVRFVAVIGTTVIPDSRTLGLWTRGELALGSFQIVAP